MLSTFAYQERFSVEENSEDESLGSSNPSERKVSFPLNERGSFIFSGSPKDLDESLAANIYNAQKKKLNLLPRAVPRRYSEPLSTSQSSMEGKEQKEKEPMDD